MVKMSCWKCKKPFKGGHEICYSCTANIQAYCIICYKPIRKLKVDYVHCLWDDNGWAGRPICDSCYFILNDVIPEKIDVLIKRKKPKKRGLEVWM